MKKAIIRISVLTILLTAMTAGLVFLVPDSHALLTGSALTASGPEATDPLNLEEGTVVSNVFFEGRSLSGLTPEAAADICREPMKKLRNKEYIIQSEYVEEYRYGGTAQDVGISCDDSRVDSELESLVVEGTLLERYKFAKDIQYAPVEIEVPITIDENTAISYFESLQEAWKQEAVSASVTARTGSVAVTPGQSGLSYDFSEGISQLVVDVLSGNLDDSEEYYIDPGETVTEPALTTERAATFTIIGSYTTHYAAPVTEVLANREQNLVQSTSNMNGSVFAPGAEISALTMYGSVTSEGGYRPAGTIANGSHVDEIGGGICQTTTTLYNAALYAELEIVYRHNHSMLVNYVTPSRDAMVYAAGGSDFIFKNTSSDYITIEAWVDKSTQSLTVIIIGHEDHAADHSVEYESEILEMTTASVTVVDDPSLPIGFSESVKYALNGTDAPSPAAKSRLWKVTTDGGVTTRTLVNSLDTYKAQSASYRVAPDTKLEFSINSDISTMYTTINPYYLDGTPLAWNLPAATDEEIISFNNSMTSLMAAKGLTWPYTYTGYTADSPDCRPGGQPSTEATEESTADTQPQSTDATEETEESTTEDRRPDPFQ